MKNRLERYILEGPWEKQLLDGLNHPEKWVILPVMIFAALYFGVVCISALAHVC